MEGNVKQTTEIVAFGSGKGGTGKTILASSLGYALIRSGQRVLMIDSDPATDGLSLFLLGPKGSDQTGSFRTDETFTGVISHFTETGQLEVTPRTIHRSESSDHGISYSAIISGKNPYGDIPSTGSIQKVPDLSQASFRKAVAALFAKLRTSGQYDYVLVDTRGGFAFESTDVCALADSFIVVTEPTYSSFYQDRNLVKRISAAAKELQTRPLLRSIIVNKATEGEVAADGRLSLENLEASFRLELEREFPVKFKETHAVPLDVEAIKAYKEQAMPYVKAPASPFSFATLAAFRDILQVVTSRWSTEQVSGWNGLIDTVSSALEGRYRNIQKEKEETIARMAEVEKLRKRVTEYEQLVANLERDAVRIEGQYKRELERTQSLLSRLEVTSSPAWSKTGSGEKAPQGPSWFQRYKRLSFVWRAVFIGVLLSVVALSSYLGRRWYYAAHLESLLTNTYNSGIPPALRTNDLRSLLVTYNIKTFDSLNFPGANLDGQNLYAASFRSAILSNASFRQARLERVNFSDATLSGARFEDSDLRQVDFTRANLTGALLARAVLDGAILYDADLRGADLTGAQVSSRQLTNALLDEKTIMPDGKPGPLLPKALK